MASVSNAGIFSVLLGDTVSLPADTLNRNPYLGIQVGSDGEMTPRQYLSSVPFARILAPGAVVTGSTDSPMLGVLNRNGIASEGVASAAPSGWGDVAGVAGESNSDHTFGVFGKSDWGVAIQGQPSATPTATLR
jgi:hypothetical protein